MSTDPPTFPAFFQVSDFHGLRFVFEITLSPFRRRVWLLVFLLSVAGLTYIVITRINYYYSYPSVYNMKIDPHHAPLPQVLICPNRTSFFGKREIGLLFPSEDEWATLSDVTVAYFTSEVLGITGLLQNTSGELTLNKTVMEVFYSIPLNISDAAFTSELSRKFMLQTGWMSGDVPSVRKVFGRIKTLNPNLRLQPSSDYVKYAREVGVTRELVKSCTFTSYHVTRECEPLTTVMSNYGSCLLFTNIKGHAAEFSGHDKGEETRLTISLKNKYQNYYKNFENSYKLFLYDRGDAVPTYHLHDSRVKEASLTATSSVLKVYEIEKAYERRSLDKPYGEGCGEERYSRCMHRCLPRKSDYLLLTEGYDFQEMDVCLEKCPVSCHHTSFTLSTASRHPLNGSMAITLQPKTKLLFEQYVQESLYSAEALLTEIGGAMGLFIGASVLTLYHVLEYTCVRAWKACHRAEGL